MSDLWKEWNEQASVCQHLHSSAPRIWGCVSQMCWHSYPEPGAGIGHHRLAELSQQCWISSPASVLGGQSAGLAERERDSEHLISGEICSWVCLGSWAWLCHGNRQKQQVQEGGTALLVAERDQGSATDLHEVSHHQMLFCIQICSREHIPSGSNLGKSRGKGYKWLCLQHSAFLASIQTIPLV